MTFESRFAKLLKKKPEWQPQQEEQQQQIKRKTRKEEKLIKKKSSADKEKNVADLMEQMDEMAKKLGFLVYDSGRFYEKTLTRNASLFLELEKGSYKLYKLKWWSPSKDSAIPEKKWLLKEEKFYFKGRFRQAIEKAKRIIEFYEKKVAKR